MTKRIFISFAVEDSNLRDLLVGQSKNDNCPFDFSSSSVNSSLYSNKIVGLVSITLLFILLFYYY